MLNYFEKRKLKAMLLPCNFMLAGEIIHTKFASSTGQNALTELIQDYMANPGFEMAVKLIEYEPQLTIYFVECNPEGFYSRQMQKKMIDTQEHQAFLSHLAGKSDDLGFAEAAAAAAPPTKPAKRATKEEQPEQPLPPRAKSGGGSAQEDPLLRPLLTEGRDFSNVIQTLRDSIRELQQQVIECELELAELERRGSNQVDMRKRWLSVCKDGVKEFEAAIRVLQALGEGNTGSGGR